IGPRTIRAGWVVGEGIAGQHRSNCRIHRYLQRVRAAVRVLHDVLTRSLGCGWYSQNLGRSQHLPESLILHKIERAVSAVIQMRQHDRPAIRKSELISSDWTNSAWHRHRLEIDIITRLFIRVTYTL